MTTKTLPTLDTVKLLLPNSNFDEQSNRTKFAVWRLQSISLYFWNMYFAVAPFCYCRMFYLSIEIGLNYLGCK